jgi:hypothetical protein
MPKPKSFPNKILIGFSDDHLKTLDQWRRKQEDMPTRSEAIRRLVEIGSPRRLARSAHFYCSLEVSLTSSPLIT